MGILNVTPDSFSDGGGYLSVEQALAHAEQMAADGADLIDVGGESTRPGAPSVAVEEECRRVLPVIERLARRLPIPISIDTSKALVAQRALEAGASLINDVTALRGEGDMAAVAARARVPIILMHMRGTPRTMQQAPRYRNVVDDVARWLREAARGAQAAGITRERIWLDPGLGFGKTVRHNLTLLRRLDVLQGVGCPIVIGPSRKSFIGHTLNLPADDRLEGTLACVGYAMAHGVAVVRVHDVKPAVRFITMWQAIQHVDTTRRQHRSRRHRQASALRVGA